jgi:hypothetical protein
MLIEASFTAGKYSRSLKLTHSTPRFRKRGASTPRYLTPSESFRYWKQDTSIQTDWNPQTKNKFLKWVLGLWIWIAWLLFIILSNTVTKKTSFCPHRQGQKLKTSACLCTRNVPPTGNKNKKCFHVYNVWNVSVHFRNKRHNCSVLGAKVGTSFGEFSILNFLYKHDAMTWRRTSHDDRAAPTS